MIAGKATFTVVAPKVMVMIPTKQVTVASHL